MSLIASSFEKVGQDLCIHSLVLDVQDLTLGLVDHGIKLIVTNSANIERVAIKHLFQMLRHHSIPPQLLREDVVFGLESSAVVTVPLLASRASVHSTPRY